MSKEHKITQTQKTPMTCRRKRFISLQECFNYTDKCTTLTSVLNQWRKGTIE
jgi:hypothetical protein